VREASDEHGSGAPVSASAPVQAPPRRDPCPELAEVSKKEFAELHVAALSLALAITKSKARSEEIVQQSFEALMTTRRWNPGGTPLLNHLLGIVKSLLHHQHASRSAARDARAHDGFYAEVAGDRTPSTEEMTLDRAADDDRQRRAASEIEQLTTAVAHNTVVSGVLRCRIEGSTKAAAIAQQLKVRVEQVYAANDLLKHHLRRIRAGARDEGEKS
jgi:DNA-directed RNA polymerase specialized sigma24 family protein